MTEERDLSYRRIPSNKSNRNQGNRKPPLEHHINNLITGKIHPRMRKLVGRSLKRSSVYV